MGSGEWLADLGEQVFHGSFAPVAPMPDGFEDASDSSCQQRNSDCNDSSSSSSWALVQVLPDSRSLSQLEFRTFDIMVCWSVPLASYG